MKHYWFQYMEAATGDEGAGSGGGGATGEGGGGATGEGGGADDGGSPPPSDWPADWRGKISSDEKHQKTLARFASPKALYESYTSLRQKFDSGEYKAQTPFPEKGTDEEKIAWKKANGIPEKPEGYKDFLKDLKLDEEDSGFVDDLMTHAHAENLPPQSVKSVLKWYTNYSERVQQATAERDSEQLHAAEDALRTEWGGEYRRNINLITGLVGTMPKDVQPLFVGARLANGEAMLNKPEIARWLLETALTVNPVSTVVPGAGANVASAIEDEITSIENVMRTDRQKYNKDEKMQGRLRELYSARERSKR